MAKKVSRTSSSLRTRNLEVLVFAGLLGLQFLFWTVGADPVERALSEPEEVSAALESRRVVPLNELLAMTDQSPHRWVMSEGFGQPEPDGTWVTASQAVIKFTVEDGEPREILFSMSALTEPGKTTRTVEIVTTAGITVREVDRSGKLFSVALTEDLGQTVQLRCDSLLTPNSNAGAVDGRALCVKLFAIEIRS